LYGRYMSNALQYSNMQRWDVMSKVKSNLCYSRLSYKAYPLPESVSEAGV
jgi:hypothetical protein